MFCSFETSGITWDLKYNKLTIEPRICTKILTTTVYARFCKKMPAGDLNSKIPLAQNFQLWPSGLLRCSNHLKMMLSIVCSSLQTAWSFVLVWLMNSGTTCSPRAFRIRALHCCILWSHSVIFLASTKLFVCGRVGLEVSTVTNWVLSDHTRSGILCSQKISFGNSRPFLLNVQSDGNVLMKIVFKWKIRAAWPSNLRHQQPQLTAQETWLYFSETLSQSQKNLFHQNEMNKHIKTCVQVQNSKNESFLDILDNRAPNNKVRIGRKQTK